MSELHRFETRDALDKALAAAIAERLSAAVAARGNAYLVVSGGSTPKGLFAQLSATPIEWSAITVLLADERVVTLDSADRNERMVRECLLISHAAKANFVSLIADSDDVAASLGSVHAALANVPEFDVVVLGMGGDAHTASLFPCASELEAGLTTQADALMTSPTTAPHRRVSLSLQRLQRTRHGLIHIVGDDKLQVLEQAQASGDVRQHPIAAFLGDAGFDVWYSP